MVGEKLSRLGGHCMTFKRMEVCNGAREGGGEVSNSDSSKGVGGEIEGERRCAYELTKNSLSK